MLNNQDDKLKPGMFISGTATTTANINNNSLFIPKSAVLWTGKRSIIYVKTKVNEAVFEMREVVLGDTYDDTYMVISGLNADEEIVTNGTFTIDAAAQLQGKKSMMNKRSHEDGMHTSMERESREVIIDEAFQIQLRTLFSDYITLKNELVADNGNNAQLASKEILKNLKKVDVSLLKDENRERQKWTIISDKIEKLTLEISKTSSIDKQRRLFKPLSEQFIEGVERYGINQKVYKLFCPMADNNIGANWLSFEKEIKNPFFGKTMLTCGEVKDEIE